MQGKRSQLKLQHCKLQSSSYSSMNGIFRYLVPLSSPESTLPNSNSRQISSILTDMINYKELQISNNHLYMRGLGIHKISVYRILRYATNSLELGSVRPCKRNTNVSLRHFCIKKRERAFSDFFINWPFDSLLHSRLADQPFECFLDKLIPSHCGDNYISCSYSVGHIFMKNVRYFINTNLIYFDT